VAAQQGSLDPQKLDSYTGGAYWCIRFLSEAFKKHRVFYHSFEANRTKLRKAFSRQGRMAEQYWDSRLSVFVVNAWCQLLRNLKIILRAIQAEVTIIRAAE